MKNFLTSLSLALMVATPAIAESMGDAKIGKTLHDKSCIACHASKFGGDGSKMYTRADRKVSSQQQLSSRVKACNNNVGSGWFPEEEAHVAAYLNATFYHLK
ncbi:MAG: cytochrome c [Pseudomonadota bacterium]|nr:cytochrome c [Gammaproteobacteria bacterium]MBU1732519.1 cytochrome c [Gammaproteobacteria bacterium]MBU1892655.1 cytochrome c [Gammaproteobacteria bacterium]